jgi:AcrR family transcriptional regulator
VPRRRYDGSRRRADAVARQRRIIEMATTLFVEQGFGATSIDQIAGAADVSSPTVYAMFGSKARLLARAIDVALAGDDEDIGVIDRLLPLLEEAGANPRRQFAALARFNRALSERVAPLIRVMEQAASTDPALEELRSKLLRAIRSDCAVGVEKLCRNRLRPDLSESEAADIMAAMLSPYVYSMLTVDMRWSPERYQQWVADTLSRSLLWPDALPA